MRAGLLPQQVSDRRGKTDIKNKNLRKRKEGKNYDWRS